MNWKIFLIGVATFFGVMAYLALTPGQAGALDENDCLKCHGIPQLSKFGESGGKISLYVDRAALEASAHRYIDCTTCHTTKPHEVVTPLTKLSLAEKCGTCHQYEYKLHLNSIHGKQLVQGNPDVATCVDCHSPQGNPHSVIRVLEYEAPAYKKNIAQTCAKCHDNPELMGRYGIVEKVYESYMRSFHGKALELASYEISQLNKATCTNCHGSHDIKPVTDPKAPVAGMDSLAKTCEQCHPGAGTRFASGFLGHKEATPATYPIVYYAERFFIILTVSVIGLGLLLVLFEASRWLARPKGKND